MTTNKPYIATLNVPEMPKKAKDKERMVEWLRNIAKEIKKEDPKVYASPCRFRLMK